MITTVVADRMPDCIATKLFRLVQVSGSHELCFPDPTRLAQAIMMGN